MKKFLLLSYGFETPTPKIMEAWNKWFASIKPNIVDMGHFRNGKEISKSGTKDLTMGPDAITGFVVVNANSFEEAEQLAQTNPYITSIRVYEMMSK